MSDEENSADAGEKKVSYPQKYWWLILVALPLALALIKLVPEFGSKKSTGAGFSSQQTGDHNVAISGNGNILSTDLSTKTYVINMAAIEKEFAVIKREPLRDDELKKEIEQALALLAAGKPSESAAAFETVNRKVSLPSLQTDLGVAYQKAGDTKAATQAFSKVLEQDPNYAAAHHNLGLVKAARGELVEARAHFERSGEIGDSQILAGAIQQELKTHDYELEPNNQPAEANILPLEKSVAGNLSEGGESDFFRITTPPKHRDILQVRIENQSTTLRPGLNIFDRNKSGLSGNANDTPNADLEHEFSVPPDAIFFLQVYGRSGSTGRYTLTARALNRYDGFEPDDNIRQPAAIEIGREISANIMDEADADFYRFTSAAKGGKILIHLENRSTTLRPGLNVFDHNKSALSGDANDTAGADLAYSLTTDPKAVYFLQVYGRSGSCGDYALTITQE